MMVVFVAIAGLAQADPPESTPVATTTEAPATADSSFALEEENWCEDGSCLFLVSPFLPLDLIVSSDIVITQ